MLLAGVEMGTTNRPGAQDVLGKLARSSLRMSVDLYDEGGRTLAARD